MKTLTRGGLAVFVLAVAAMSGCKGRTAALCRDALDEWTAAMPGSGPTDAEKKVFLSRCESLSPEAAACVKPSYLATHVAQCKAQQKALEALK